jgi:hypothetical protein
MLAGAGGSILYLNKIMCDQEALASLYAAAFNAGIFSDFVIADIGLIGCVVPERSEQIVELESV